MSLPQYGVSSMWKPLYQHLFIPWQKSYLWGPMHRWVFLSWRYNLILNVQLLFFFLHANGIVQMAMIYCDIGYLFDDLTDRGCIAKNQCPCIHNGNIYEPGQTYRSNCKEWWLYIYFLYMLHYFFNVICTSLLPSIVLLWNYIVLCYC